MHRTFDCDMTDPNLFACYNCKGTSAKGHGAADRQCPAFIEQLSTLQARNPETKYKYFPTNDPKSWETTARMLQKTNTQDATWHDGHQWRGGWTQTNDTLNNGRKYGRNAEYQDGSQTHRETRGSDVRPTQRDEGHGRGIGGGGRGGRGRGEGSAGRGRRGAGEEVWPTDRSRQMTLRDAFTCQTGSRQRKATGANTIPLDGTRTTGPQQEQQRGNPTLSWDDEVREAETEARLALAQAHNTQDPATTEDDSNV